MSDEDYDRIYNPVTGETTRVESAGGFGWSVTGDRFKQWSEDENGRVESDMPLCEAMPLLEDVFPDWILEAMKLDQP